jgi:hypothetical protein
VMDARVNPRTKSGDAHDDQADQIDRNPLWEHVPVISSESRHRSPFSEANIYAKSPDDPEWGIGRRLPSNLMVETMLATSRNPRFAG